MVSFVIISPFIKINGFGFIWKPAGLNVFTVVEPPVAYHNKLLPFICQVATGLATPLRPKQTRYGPTTDHRTRVDLPSKDSGGAKAMKIDGGANVSILLRKLS